MRNLTAQPKEVDAAQAVVVTNTPSSPVPVRDVDNPARSPFEASLAFDMRDGVDNNQASFAVPAGKRLVIEFVTAIVRVPQGQSVIVLFFAQIAPSGPPGIGHVIVVTPQGVFNEDNNFMASQQMRVYADPWTQVIFEVSRNASAGLASGNVSVTGYLVSVP